MTMATYPEKETSLGGAVLPGGTVPVGTKKGTVIDFSVRVIDFLVPTLKPCISFVF